MFKMDVGVLSYDSNLLVVDRRLDRLFEGIETSRRTGKDISYHLLFLTLLAYRGEAFTGEGVELDKGDMGG